MAHDDSGKDIIREHTRSIVNEKISEYPYSPNDFSDDQIDSITDGIIDGLGLTPTFVAEGHVVISGAFSRGAK